MRKLAWSVVGIAAAALPLVLLGRVAATRSLERPQDGRLVRVSRRDVGTTVKATGVVKPMIGAEVKVGSRVSGVVERLHVRIGDRVEKGQLLAQLDAHELVARRDQAEAALRSARASLAYAQAELARKRELAAARLIAPSQLDLAATAAGVAEQQRAEAEANLDYARTQLGYARIEAPIAGVVSSVSTQEGETVSASLAAPTFVTLLDLARLEVRAYVDETDIGRIRLGQKAAFTVDTYPGREFAGRVTAIYPQAEIRDNVVDYVTVVGFEAPRDGVLRPEMTTTVKISLGVHENALAVPRAALRREEGRPYVLCTQGDRSVRRPVRTGLSDEGYWEIVEGLQEGEEVLEVRE